MKRKKTNRKKSFLALTSVERERQLARFDKEIDVEKETRPLSARQRILFERMRGTPSKSILALAVEPDLIDEAHAAAEKSGMSFDEFVRSSIRGGIAFSQR